MVDKNKKKIGENNNQKKGKHDQDIICNIQETPMWDTNSRSTNIGYKIRKRKWESTIKEVRNEKQRIPRREERQIEAATLAPGIQLIGIKRGPRDKIQQSYRLGDVLSALAGAGKESFSVCYSF